VADGGLEEVLARLDDGVPAEEARNAVAARPALRVQVRKIKGSARALEVQVTGIAASTTGSPRASASVCVRALVFAPEGGTWRLKEYSIVDARQLATGP
jgi:hypothetical protein